MGIHTETKKKDYVYVYINPLTLISAELFYENQTNFNLKSSQMF